GRTAGLDRSSSVRSRAEPGTGYAVSRPGAASRRAAELRTFQKPPSGVGSDVAAAGRYAARDSRSTGRSGERRSGGDRPAKAESGYCHITAPISGRIGIRLVDVG